MINLTSLKLSSNTMLNVGQDSISQKAFKHQITLNSVFSRDVLSLGDTESPYQTYSAPKSTSKYSELVVRENPYTMDHPKPWNFLQFAKLSLTEVFSVALGGPIPNGVTHSPRDWREGELEYLQAFQQRIERVARAGNNIKEMQIGGDAEMTDDERFDAIIAKYIGEPISYIQFLEMRDELFEAGLIDADEGLLISEQGGDVGFEIESMRLFRVYMDSKAKADVEYKVPDLEGMFLEDIEKHNEEEIARMREKIEDGGNLEQMKNQREKSDDAVHDQ